MITVLSIRLGAGWKEDGGGGVGIMLFNICFSHLLTSSAVLPHRRRGEVNLSFRSAVESANKEYSQRNGSWSGEVEREN